MAGYMNSQRMTTPVQQQDAHTLDDRTCAQLTTRFAGSDVQGILLTGSYARGDAGPFSDVDLVRLVADGAAPDGAGSHLIAGKLVTVSNVDSVGIEAWFSDPEQIIDAVQSLRDARILVDEHGLCRAVQQRARAFQWSTEHQRKADRIAGQALVGWIEEAHKGLEGLRRAHPGRLLNARFGLSWGLTHVFRVQRGILRGSDNDVLDGIVQALAPDRQWIDTAARAFGLNGEPLRDQVIAGLQLYVLTAKPLLPRVTPQIRTMLTSTIDTIRRELRANEQ